MNQDIEMMNVDDLNLQYNPQQASSHLTTNNNEQLNDQFNGPSLNVPVDATGTTTITNITENIEDSDESDEDDDEGGGGGDADADKDKDDDDDNDDGEEDEDDDIFINDNETKTPGEILDEFCQKLEDINTTLPDSVINYYMRKSGFIVNDPKLVKIISIASQKFISEIVNDVWQRQRLKTKQGSVPATSQAASTTSTNNPTSSNAATAAAGTSSASASGSEQPKLTKAAANAANAASSNAANAANTAQLTLEDLTQVLADYGINVKKPYYFI
jgi:transcription initiation factor TFIID subunit 10